MEGQVVRFVSRGGGVVGIVSAPERLSLEGDRRKIALMLELSF